MGDTDSIEQVSFSLNSTLLSHMYFDQRKNQRHVPAPYRNSSAAAVILEAEIP